MSKIERFPLTKKPVPGNANLPNSQPSGGGGGGGIIVPPPVAQRLTLTKVNTERRVRIGINEPVDPQPIFTFNTLVFEDHFTGNALNTSNWSIRTGPWGAGAEQQYYTSVNHTVANSLLTIQAKYEPAGAGAGDGRPYTSTRIDSEDKKYWKYGRIEARIRCAQAGGIWPAFWMLGQDNTLTPGTTGVYPYQGEIDIVELISPTPTKTYANIHFWSGVSGNNQKASGSGPYETDLNLLGGDFHTYSIEWTATGIKWFYDGILYHSENTAADNPRFVPANYDPFQKEFYLLLNLAVGGWGGTPVSGQYPATMEIDYVRVYQ